MNLGYLIQSGIGYFLFSIYEDIIKLFGSVLVDIMSTSLNVLHIPFVKTAIGYAQLLAFTLVVLKVINEIIQTLILYQSGDADQDPVGMIVRTVQAVAVISTLPWIVEQVFTFGAKVANDVSGLGAGSVTLSPFDMFFKSIELGSGVTWILIALVIAICMIVIAIQSAIRGAELALMAVIGPIMALNLTANNTSIWSAWFKQLVIVCTAQALQLFMIQGAFYLFQGTKAFSPKDTLLMFGWLWMAIKTPNFIKQFAYSTGFSGAMGSGVKQAGSMAMMRRMMASK